MTVIFPLSILDCQELALKSSTKTEKFETIEIEHQTVFLVKNVKESFRQIKAKIIKTWCLRLFCDIKE